MKSKRRSAAPHLIVVLFVLLASLGLLVYPAGAQTSQDCEALKKQINDLLDALPKLGVEIERLSKEFDKVDQQIQRMDEYAEKHPLLVKWHDLTVKEGTEWLNARGTWVRFRNSYKKAIEDSKLTIQAIKDTIADLNKQLGDCGAKKLEEPPRPKTKSSLSPISAAIDSCLVGTWRSESLVSEVGYKGGAGIVLTIKPDGLETIDYNGMKPIEGNGETHLWRGIVEAYFTTSKGTATVTKTGKTDLTVKETYRDGRTSEKNTKALGLAALGNYATDRSYTCDGTTLTFKSPLHTATFKREKR